MAKGTVFEKKALTYLKFLFEHLGFRVLEARRQRSGTQNGFDIRIRFLDDSGKERKFYFECKDYTNPIYWKDISGKILELHASSHKPDGYIALSPHVDFSNIDINVLEKLPDTVQAPIQIWSPDANVKEYFSLHEDTFVSVYGQKPLITDNDKELTRQKLRALILDMLRQKDQLVEKSTGTSFPKELTLKIPRIHPDDIIGRADELEELHQLLFNNEKVVVVNGLGGIGKTTLAQGYISKYYKNYHHVAWISQLTDDIVNDIINATGLTENLSVSREVKEAVQVFHDILRALKSFPDGPNLLVLDNADEKLAELKEILPGQPTWHVLATSRKLVEGFYPKELDFLSPEKALSLFRKHCSRIKNETQIAELVKAIDYHTLTVEILAKTAQLRRVDIETLKKSIKDDLKSNVYVEHKGEKIDKVFSYLSSIFNLSGLNEDEVWLMKQFSCLPAEFHAYNLLLELIDPDENKKEVFAEILSKLVEQGWLMHNMETDAYKMHLIVGEVVAGKLLPVWTDIKGLLNTIIRNLVLDQTKDNPVDKFIWIPYGNALLHRFPNETSVPIALLQNNQAIILQTLRDYAVARVLLEKSVQSAGKNFGPDHPTTAMRYSNLALVLKDLGDYKGAKALLEKAVQSNEESFGSDHSATAVRYSNLASVLKHLGDYTGARALLEKAVQSAEKSFGPDHPTTAVRYSKLALALKDLGDYTGAKALLEKAVQSAEKSFSPDHPTIAVRYSNLAAVLQDLGDYPRARALLEKSVQSAEKSFGPDHPTTAVRYSNLAVLLKDLGDYTGAWALLEKAVQSAEKSFGPDHPSTAVRYSNLASVLQDLGDHTKAKALLEKAVQSAEKTLGPDHPTTALRYSNLASLLKNMGDYTQALELSKNSLSIFKKVLPEGHPYISMAQRNYDSIKKRL